MSEETKANPKMVLPDCKSATHMPFFDGSTLAFCQAGPAIEKTIPKTGSIFKEIRRNPALAERFKGLSAVETLRYRPWKLAYCTIDDKTIHQIYTGLPDEGIECSPAFFRDDQGVHLSFIAGTPSEYGNGYRLYTASGADLGNLEPAVALSRRSVFFGFNGPHHTLSGVGNSFTLEERATGKEFEFESDFARILRATFQADSPAKLVFTGIDREAQYRTVLFDLEDNSTFDVFAGEHVYKSTLCGDQLIYAKKTGEGFEDRRLFQSRCDLKPSSLRIFNKN